jgi:ABC-type multidrug transport system fused ATPase/permease subunit
VRSNIGPWQNSTDNKLTEILIHVALWEVIHAHGGADADAQGITFPLEQLQLLPLARVLVQGRKIVVMDEMVSGYAVSSAHVSASYKG